MKYALGVAALALLSASSFAHAQHAGHGNHATPKPTATEAPATKAYRAVNDKMHAGMNLKFSGDADVDFLRGMIPHHQGAIDMAKIVLQYGKDQRVRKLAEEIIRAQEQEISEMNKWLAEMKK